MSALAASDLPVDKCQLHLPALEELAKVVEAGLALNFAEAKVEVVDCPDLTQAEWGLAAEGLSGNTRILDIGGVPYLIPTAQKDKLYDMKDYPLLTGSKEGLIIGAGAGPWPYIDRNSEMMPNLFVHADGSVNQETHIARTHDHDGSYETQKLPATETRNALLGNLFLCDGKPGPVLRIHCKGRTGKTNLVTCMRETLNAHYGEKAVALGGVFKVQAGSVKIHVMPDFSPCPLQTDEDVNNWLKFYTVPAPFTVLSVLISRDPGQDLRVEHSHGWGPGGTGGHYHYDTTPQEVEYLGYYSPAEYSYRVDRPKETHLVGRD